MGDMADFALDRACEECEEYDNFQSGKYDLSEAYERGLINEHGGEEPGPKGWNTLYQPAPVQLACKKCNQTGLSWKAHTSGKWWLWDNNLDCWHTCRKG